MAVFFTEAQNCIGINMALFFGSLLVQPSKMTDWKIKENARLSLQQVKNTTELKARLLSYRLV
jgi:uncharacterized protein